LELPLKQSVYAVSPYQSGYNHGCSDAQLGGHPYLDTPGKGPSFHTGIFMQGYYNGYNSCSNGAGEQQGGTSRNINWEQLCLEYGGLLGIHTPCDQLAHGTQLTQQGRTALACLFTGGVGVLTGVINIGNLRTIEAAASTICP
jgi:hypothetical protein